MKMNWWKRVCAGMLALGVSLIIGACGQGQEAEEPDNDVTVTYEVVGGGYIDGEEVQVVLLGESTTPVYAEANDGWVFVGWSDGYDNPYRSGDTVDKDTVITAYFEEIGAIEDGERPPSESEYGEPSAPDLGVSNE